MSSGKPRPERRLTAALRALSRALDELDAPSMIIGGVAVIAHGVARVTRDIDATVGCAHASIDRVVRAMAAHGIEPRIPDAESFAQQSFVLLMEHLDSRIEIDLSLASLGFEADALAAAQTVTIAGVAVRVARPEDLVIYKVAAWRPQDQMDVLRLVELHGSSMRLDRIQDIAKEICEILDVPERLAELAAMLPN
jgi:hypothetical protein